MIVIIMCIVVILTALIVTLIGIAANDLQGIRYERSFQRHPHARRWRVKPRIAFDTTDKKQFVELRRVYRNLTTSDSQTDWTLSIPDGISIEPAHIPHAVRRLNDSARSSQLILPRIDSPDSLKSLLGAYTVMVGAPIASARNGFGVAAADCYPVIARTNHAPSRLSILYDVASFVMTMLLIACFILSFAAAILFATPEPLIAILVTFGLWAVWSIGRYPDISLPRRLLFILLLPAALGFLFIRFSSLPARQAARLILSRGAMIKA